MTDNRPDWDNQFAESEDERNERLAARRRAMSWHRLRDTNIEIEVSPEMIRAGVAVICVGASKTTEDMVRKIYLEMRRAYMRRTPGYGIRQVTK